MTGKKPPSGGPGKRGRSAETGQFVKQSEVRKHPKTTVDETVKPRPKPKKK